MTKKQVIEYHINYHIFLEWQNIPQNQTFTSFSNTNSELNQQKFQLVKGSSIQFKPFSKNQLTPSCNHFIPNLSFKISNTSQKQEVNEDVDVFTDSNFERRILQNYPIKSQAAKQNTLISSPLHFFTERQQIYSLYQVNQQIAFWPKFIPSNVSKLETNESYLEQNVKNSIFLKKIRSEEMTLKILKYPAKPRYSINNSLNPKKIMIFGETGADKSTLINFFCNFYIGVQFEFPYRFCLVDETDEFDFSYTSAFSKFQGVLSYDIIGSDLKPNLRIIDTPEFSDKKEQNLDQFFYKIITDQFIKLESLNLICFVMRLNQNQLSLFQMQIMNRLLQIFGNDVGEHIMFLSTSSDIDETKVSEYLLQPGSPFINIVPKIQAPYVLQSKDKEIWDESYSQFKILYEEKICKIKNLNLNLTRLVIQKRNSIQDIIKELKYQIQEHLNLIDNIQNQTDSDINEILKTKQQESLNEFGIKIRKLLLSIKDLNTIALQPLLTDFQQECLGFLIKEEEEQKKESYQMRVQGLRDIQQLWDSISTQLSEHDIKK
ncbi:unnamed protein product [Paramecium pentaurelia]|uniref:G domain-containing protein n=1 Tax=Paramecium pentaurelia TaxID=43138 RepID=A0A8S1Y0L6_9CILI|nr:unnamed protein product [Paramecium pentaurelia]